MLHELAVKRSKGTSGMPWGLSYIPEYQSFINCSYWQNPRTWSDTGLVSQKCKCVCQYTTGEQITSGKWVSSVKAKCYYIHVFTSHACMLLQRDPTCWVSFCRIAWEHDVFLKCVTFLILKKRKYNFRCQVTIPGKTWILETPDYDPAIIVLSVLVWHFMVGCPLFELVFFSKY